MYWLKQQDRQAVLAPSGSTATSATDNAAQGNSPKLALAWQASERALFFASAAKGYRQGSAQLDAGVLGCVPSLNAMGETAESIKKLKPDSLWSYELGSKTEFSNLGLMLTTSVFHIDWHDIQQQFLLSNCGLFVQGNAGNAKIDGAEVELLGRVSTTTKVRASLGYQDARITKTGHTGQALGSRIYQTPTWTASLGGVYTRRLSDTLTGLLSADYSYVGSSISANSGAAVTLVRPGYGLFNLRASANWKSSELALTVKNVLNTRPNLGDITYVGYGLYTDASRTTPIPQVATLAPRTITLWYSHWFQ
jgi:outer membrane receptor protein involved in Fe transport